MGGLATLGSEEQAIAVFREISGYDARLGVKWFGNDAVYEIRVSVGSLAAEEINGLLNAINGYDFTFEAGAAGAELVI